MILYHGSSIEVRTPDLSHSREDIDFGAGFYTTADREMAEKWACAKKNSVISIYDVDLEKLNKFYFELNTEWLEYIKANRKFEGSHLYDEYDLLIGPTADDKLYNTLEDYLSGYLTEEETIRFLNIAGYSKQYVFKSESGLQYCRFVESVEIKGERKDFIRKKTIEERMKALQELDILKKEAAQRRQELSFEIRKKGRTR